jgi:hypothetical protein
VANNNYQQAVKITFLSWITGSTKVSYEHVLPHRQTAEICGSIIGAGYDKFGNRPTGFTLRYAHKFFIGDRYDGGLAGLYLRPEAIYSHYDYDARHTALRTPARMSTLLATAGYQITRGHLVVDAWAGAGPAFGTPAETGYHHGFALFNLFGMQSDHIALSFSIRLGYCF